jgi:3-keto-5-aminohexanoate cleavage enzyme
MLLKEDLMEKLIITAAITGSLTTKEQNPNIPYTPEEIAESAIESCKAGAAVAHLHVRDPLTGKAVQNVDLFKKVIRLIRKRCDILINTTTGGGPNMTFDDRIGIIPALAKETDVKPEIASLNAGSLNFGILSRSKKEFTLDDVQMNPWSQLQRFAETIKKHGVKPEVEIYDSAMINNAMVLLKELDAIVPPLHFQFVLGVLGGLQPTVDNLIFLKNSIPPGSTWSVCSLGLSIFSLGPVAIAAGGHLRLGLEDGVYISKGKLAESNAELVAKIKRIASEMGREVATPDEARKLLSL